MWIIFILVLLLLLLGKLGYLGDVFWEIVLPFSIIFLILFVSGFAWNILTEFGVGKLTAILVVIGAIAAITIVTIFFIGGDSGRRESDSISILQNMQYHHCPTCNGVERVVDCITGQQMNTLHPPPGYKECH